MNCAVCNSPLNEKGSCPVCGFDEGRDYRNFPTLSPLPSGDYLKGLRDIFNRSKTRLFCPVCKGFSFSILPEQQSIVCTTCGKERSFQELQPVLGFSAKAPAPESSSSWGIDMECGTLVISGKGPMEDYEPCGAPWYRYRWNLTKVIVEEGFTSIGNNAFYGCLLLSDVSIPNGIVRIGEGAFYRCSKLQSIDLPKSLTSIGSSAFKLCAALEQLRVPASVTFIGSDAFASCQNLETLTLAFKSSYIGADAFSKCGSLRRVYFSGSKGDWRAIQLGRIPDSLSDAKIFYNTSSMAMKE